MFMLVYDVFLSFYVSFWFCRSCGLLYLCKTQWSVVFLPILSLHTFLLYHNNSCT